MAKTLEDSTNDEVPTRWDALKSILFSAEKRKAIGHAWILYFHLVFHMDSRNELLTNFQRLAKDLDESVATIKRWKRKLVTANVVSSRQINHGIALTLLPPYDSPATAMKDDIVELRLRSDPKTRNMLKMALGSDYLVLLPILSDLVHRVQRLEKINSSSQ